MAKQRYEVLSPDGFRIAFEPVSYSSKENAESALTEWMKRYEHQGFYSSPKGRIPLDELREHCQVRPL